MKLISVNALKVDEVLGCDIRSSNGGMLLRQGALITDKVINRLKMVGIYSVYIDDEMFEDIDVRLALTDETKARIVGDLEEIHNKAKKGRKVNTDTIRLMGREIFEEVRVAILREPINMVPTFAVDAPVLIHSVNVAIMTAALAVKAQVRPQLAENYVVAALMHDICLDSLDNDYSDDYAHTQKAYDLLKFSAGVDTTCYMAASMHHEKFNGSGGPRKIDGKQINEGARLIAIADMYDNVCNGYAGFKRLPSHHAVEYLSAQSGNALDPDVIKIFASCVAIYPTGATVELNNGRLAVVVRQNDGMPTRPVVRLLSPLVEERLEFNMLSQNTLFIDRVDL